MKIKLITLLLTSLSCSAHAQWVNADRSKNLQPMADVVRTDILDHPTHAARLFSYTGGDPASNGLLLHLAVENSQNYEWNIYPIKDVAEYRLLPSAQQGYIKLELKTDDGMDEQGNITHSTSTMFINLTQAHLPNGKIEMREVKR